MIRPLLPMFDARRFYVALYEIKGLERTWRTVAREAGVQQSSLSRIGAAHQPSVETVARLIRWSGLIFEDYVSEKIR